MGEEEPSQRTRTLRRRTLVWTAIAVGALALLVAAGAVTVSILNQERTAQATAQQYFDALARGDATTANALTAPATDATGDTSLLTDEMLASANELISEVSVTAADDPLDTFDQKVEVSYTLAGERHTVTLVLAQGEPVWAFLNTWQLRSPFSERLVFSMTGTSTFMVGDAPIDGTAPAAQLFPAVYPLAAASPDYFTMEDDQLVINGTDSNPSVAFIPTPALTAAVQEQVNAIVDTLAESTDVSHAPWPYPLSTVLPNAGIAPGTWEIIEYPTVEPSLIVGGSVFVTHGGRAAFSPAGGGEPVEMTREIELGVTVEVIDGEVHVTAPEFD